MARKVRNIGNQYTKTEDKRKISKNKRRAIIKKRIALFGGILLLFLIFLGFMVFNQINHNNHLSDERVKKEEEYKKLQEQEITLKEKLHNLNDKNYVEKVARDDYSLSNDGEIIFRLPKDEKNKDQSQDSKE
ncbi:FtsB family cell division protein [Staphylococcus massiliensis]|uniref:Cell-division initiation protein n=1 Tax=Staphylococcus massiliensis S46 TaxID=1229783 RepID=K9AFT6_9STAP|nr:septum formation initiator family protein [Staphylococcus massiliensis]EKU46163.1 cell-division initiation protein [Staphylococcus massiliensis S46]MCG3400544.1 septum formation initiator family protein [Staphylococcus massiliensis]MCG3402798.1 septum formation initiator family protein [Staphylococcus massiliensis]MCG3413195.1 septum formation initiator family protein [Staphylococcus massiliensis]POA01946.1 cell division protein DivIC [Staphylococcus massiliensis CCUG 55927]